MASLTPEGRAALDELRIKQGLDPELPWGGRSPRELTRAAKLFKLWREAATLDEVCEGDSLIDEQFERWRDELS